MKNTITLLAALLMALASFAQGRGINYKAVIKDDNGNVLANQNLKVKFSILDSSDNIDYSGTHTTITDANGIVILIIGSGTENVTGDYFSINWASDLYRLKVEIDPEPYGLFINMGTSTLDAVPYALNAQTAENVFSGNYNDLTNQPILTLPTGLEYLDETDNGTDDGGWRLIGRNPSHYGPIGNNAVDLSTSSIFSESRGATGEFSTAMGIGTIASGSSSTAIGFGTTASGSRSTAMGDFTIASGGSSTAMGGYTTASGDYSTASGFQSTASGDYSTAMGENTTASGDYSTAMGENTTASARASTAMGQRTIASARASTAIGKYNVADINGLFMVGNGTGTSAANRKNAFIIKEDGKTGINTSTPASLFEVAHGTTAPTTSDWTNALSIKNIPNNNSWQFWTASTGLALYRKGAYRGGFDGISGAYTQVSDSRVKKDITPLEVGTLNKVLQLNPVSYLMKDQTDTNRNLGLISQEVQAIFPSITHYVKESDLLTLSYTELIPILIKALQEQQAIIDGQTIENIKQNSTIESLLQRMTALETANN